MSKHVQPNSPLQISAEVYNHAVDQYSESMGVRTSGGAIKGRSRDTRVTVQNQLAQDLPRFAVVQLLSPLIVPTGVDDLESDFFNSIILQTAVPVDGTLYRWGVVQEAIAMGEFGECLVSGITRVKIDQPSSPTYQNFAVPGGNINYLIGSKCGIARILWRQTGSGPQWALIHIG